MIAVAAASLLVLGQLSTVAAGSPADSLVRVRMTTELGAIEVEVDVGRAPVTASNFLRYVDAGLYADGTFHRSVRMDNQPDDSVRIEVVQGDMDRRRRSEGFDPIPMEGTGTTGLRHEDGTISMARGGPDSARASFFICIGPQPELDEGGARNPDGHGFAAFGRVVEGMDVVHRIHAQPVEGQRITPPVRILDARRVPTPGTRTRARPGGPDYRLWK